MKKTYPHTELSDKVCKHPNCNKKLKLRLVEEKQNVSLCYKHHCEKEAKRGHTLNTQPRKKRLEAGMPVKSF